MDGQAELRQCHQQEPQGDTGFYEGVRCKELLIDGTRVGSTYDTGAKENTAGTVATFGKVHIKKGNRKFTVRIVGEAANSKIGLDDKLLPPEQTLDLKTSYQGADGAEIFWKTADAEGNGRLNFLSAFPNAPSLTQGYTLTSV